MTNGRSFLSLLLSLCLVHGGHDSGGARSYARDHDLFPDKRMLVDIRLEAFEEDECITEGG